MISYRFQLFLFGAVALVAACLAIPGKVSAQSQQVGVTVRPALIQDKVDPGLSLSSVLRVTNNSEREQVFYFDKTSIVGLTPEGQPVFASKTQSEPEGIETWIKLPSEPVAVPAGETVEIPYAIDVPLNANPGGHFAAIFISTRPERPRETGIGIGYQVATLVNLRIAGDIIEDTQIREFWTDRSVYNTSDVFFSIRVENQGNTLSRPIGFIEVTDMFGKKVAMLQVNSVGAGVFPKTIRQFQAAWPAEGFRFGRYQATLSLVYGDEGSKTITSIQSFWVLPVKPIAIFIGSILSLILLTMFSVKFYVRRKLAAAAVAARVETVELVEPIQNFRPSSFSRLMAISSLMLGIVVLLLILLFLFFA